MQILKKTDIILHSFVDPNYLTLPSVHPQYSTDSNWQPGKDNTSILTYNISYEVKDNNKNVYIIRYQRRLELQCIIENAEKDAKEVCKIKEAMHIAIAFFLEQHTLPFYHLLNFKAMPFLEVERKRETQSILHSKTLKPFHELSAEEKNIVQRFQQIPVQMNVTREKLD